MAPAPALTVETFSPSSTPAELFARLNAHLPFSLPVLRRLQFASRKSGAVATAHSHIIYVHAGAAFPAHFAAAFVDLSRGPETECWIYSTLQDSVAPNPDPTSSAALPPAADLARGAADACACQVLALLGRVRAIESDYSAAAVAGANEVRDGLNEAHSRGHARVGALHETVRRALLAAGVRVRATGVVPAGRGWDFYATWLLRVPGDLKGGTGDDDGSDCCRLPPGCCWDVLREGDTGLVKSRTKIPKRDDTMLAVPSTVIRREDGTPIAWVYLGVDGSVSTLHVEEPYRGRGLAKAVTGRLLRTRLQELGDDGWCSTDISTTNLQSQGVFRSIGGKPAWTVSWMYLDLTTVGEPI